MSELNVAVVQRPPFNTVTSTIIYGDEEAIVLGGGLHLSDGHRLAGELLDIKRRPTFACVTHAGGEQFFGLSVVKAAFPDLVVIALPSVANAIAEVGALMLQNWQKTLGGLRNLPETLVDVTAVGTDAGATLTIEGHEVQIIGDLMGGHSSSIRVPSLSHALSDDFTYLRVHSGPLEATPESRHAWQAKMANTRKLIVDLVGQTVAHEQASRSAADPDELTDRLLSFENELIEASHSDPDSPRMRKRWPSQMSDLDLQLAADHDFISRMRGRK